VANECRSKRANNEPNFKMGRQRAKADNEPNFKRGRQQARADNEPNLKRADNGPGPTRAKNIETKMNPLGWLSDWSTEPDRHVTRVKWSLRPLLLLQKG
jgi:hypothetical protein